MPDNLLQKFYRYLFWIGYLAVLMASFIPVAGSLNRVKLGPEAFQISLDHLLHFAVYFLICIYYLTGQNHGLILFVVNPFAKLIVLLLFLATVTELVQLWVPERAFNVFDLIFNVAGVGAGVAIIKMAQRRKGTTAKRR